MNFQFHLPDVDQSWIHKIPILEKYNIDDTILEARLSKKIAHGNTAK